MNLNEFNSLIDLYFYQAKKQNSQSDFLEWLNPKNKKKFTWGETSLNIYKLAKTIKALNILSNTLSCSNELKKISRILELYW